MEIVLVRHGLPMRVETKDGAAANPSLSRIGLAQADQASDWLVAIDIDAIYSSPLQRARETAAPFAKRSGLKIGIEDDVSEFDRDSSCLLYTSPSQRD